jgi:hypothetical protein
MVAIRAETDKNVIKNFNRDQKRIYDAWRNRKAEAMPPATYEQEMKALEQTFAQLCGG